MKSLQNGIKKIIPVMNSSNLYKKAEKHFN